MTAGLHKPDSVRRAELPEGWPAREAAIRAAPKYNAHCPRCSEARLMWKLDHADNQVKLWLPYRFHVCPDGNQVVALSAETLSP